MPKRISLIRDWGTKTIDLDYYAADFLNDHGPSADDDPFARLFPPGAITLGP
jgi:hypothetical protein